MYGHFVHEAVLAAGEKESGCTVHVVDEEFDHGPVLAQVQGPRAAGRYGGDAWPRGFWNRSISLYPKTIEEFCEKLT